MEPKYFEGEYPGKTRFDELSKIFEKLKTGRSIQVVGAPGVGKGSLLKLIPYNKSLREEHLRQDEDKYHFVYMDFSEVKSRSLTDTIKFIQISISYSLSERGMNEEYDIVNKFLKEALAVPDEMMLFQGLKKTVDFLANEKELSLVLLIDRFEEYIQNSTPEFFSYLKILRNRAKYRFGVVVASTRPIESILEPQILGEFYEFIAGNIVYLPLLDAVGLEFRLNHLEEITRKKVNSTTKDKIIKQSGGHGKIARILFEASLAGDDIADTKKLLTNKQVRAALHELWRFLTPEEKNEIKKNEENELLEKLEITKNGKLSIPLFAEFMPMLEENASSKLIYDPEYNEIKKGDVDFSDKLSPSEFKLLRFLLQNEGRICEKDEIINNVWRESKTQAGVTDQALDQIIYRLRKKIEQDPNSPTLIQTVKGRGYKLS